MRNRGAILGSVMLIILASMLVGAGTTAYFYDYTQSSGNIFTAGEFVMKLRNDGDWWHDLPTATWTMSNMAPGDCVDGYIYFKNLGTVDIECIALDMDITGSSDGHGDGVWLDNYLYVEECWVSEIYDSMPACYSGTWYDLSGAADCPRNINDYCSTLEGVPHTSGKAGDDDLLMIYWYGKTGNPLIVSAKLAPGKVIGLYYKFCFHELHANQNDAMGDSLTIVLRAEAYSIDNPFGL